jgi:hypothetical protein
MVNIKLMKHNDLLTDVNPIFNLLVIPWRDVVLVAETGENHCTAANH